MPAPVQNTVDRLDKPSAYYLAKVRNELRGYGMSFADMFLEQEAEV